MTYVVKTPVDTKPTNDVRLTHCDGRLVVTQGCRSVTFRVGPSDKAVRLVRDTHQEPPAVDEIPTAVRDHILSIGYRVQGSATDGGFELLVDSSGRNISS